jgi:uncharacterized protein YjdB
MDLPRGQLVLLSARITASTKEWHMAVIEMACLHRRGQVAFVLGVLAVGSLAGCVVPDSPTTPVAGVTLDRSTLNFTVGGSPVRLVATVEPSNATDPAVTWSSSSAAVASVSAAGVVSPVAPGTAVITVKTQDGAKTATCEVTVVAATIAVTSITLDKPSLNLVAGAAPVTLVATVTPANATNRNVNWQSTDATVASVSAAGVVTPLRPGTASIVVKTADGSKSATCAVTVTAAPIAVTGVTLDKTSLNLTIGSAAPALVATVAPANATDTAVSWSSDKPDVASVDASGVVRGKAGGVATITVTTHNGSFTASCSVTVTAPTNAVTGVALDVERLDLVVGGFTAQLNATVAPANADNPSVTWTSSDAAVATVSSAGLVTAVGSGTATITVTTVEGGFTDSSAVTVHSDTVTAAALMYPLTGQIVVTWTDPVDLNATGIQVTMISVDGSVSRVVQVGAKKSVFVGLTVGTSYTVSIRVLGASGTSSDQVTISGIPEQVVKVLLSSWLENGQPTILNDSYGTASTETHDLVDTKVNEIKTDSKYPMNYRWVLMPGLTTPADSSLVSLKSEEYRSRDGGPTKEWVATERYVTIHAGAGWSDQGQWNNWTKDWGCISGTTTHLAYADTYDSSDAGAVAATFKMSPSTEIDGGVRFEWVGQSDAYLVHTCLHAGARTATEVGATFLKDSSWVLEDVTLEKYTAP